MEAHELYRGRLIDHPHLIVRDLEKSKKFYSAIFEVLGISLGAEGPGYFSYDELFVSDLGSPASAGKLTGRIHLAFQAKDEEMVRAAYQEGLKAGGTDNGKPGLREYHPGYYGAFLLDPEGNNIEAVFHGKAIRSSDAVKVTY
jgi:catechol 2,3-dioxygenase-like lactoylglutathione lyase family enzyme